MAKHASQTTSMDLAHYAVVLRRRWRHIAAGVIGGMALAGALVVLLPSSYTSTTQVDVNLISTNAFSAQRPASDMIDAQTEQSMARSTAVMNSVADELGDEWTRSSVRQSTEAFLLPDGTVMRIEFTADTPEQAAEGASAVADAYLDYRSEVAQSRVDSSAETLETRMGGLNAQLATLTRRVAAAPAGSAQAAAAELERQAVQAEIASVSSQLNELRSVSTEGGVILTEADPAQVGSTPNRAMILISGTLGGLLLGLVAAFVVNVLDRRVRDSHDVVSAGGEEVVAELEGTEIQIPAAGVDADEIRALRERLLSSNEADSPVFAVVDVAAESEQPTDVAANLAVTFADSGLLTDLVVVDHDEAALATLHAALGLTPLISNSRERRFRSATVEGLSVLIPSPDAARISASDVVAELLADGVRRAEVSVVAVAPAAGSSARLTAARSAHQVVLVVREMRSTIDQVAEVASEVHAVWGVVHGAVLLPEARVHGEASTPAKGRGKAKRGGAKGSAAEAVAAPAATVAVAEPAAPKVSADRDPFFDESSVLAESDSAAAQVDVEESESFGLPDEVEVSAAPEAEDAAADAAVDASEDAADDAEAELTEAGEDADSSDEAEEQTADEDADGPSGEPTAEDGQQSLDVDDDANAATEEAEQAEEEEHEDGSRPWAFNR